MAEDDPDLRSRAHDVVALTLVSIVIEKIKEKDPELSQILAWIVKC